MCLRLTIIFLFFTIYCNAQIIIPYPNQYKQVDGELHIQQEISVFTKEYEFEKLIPLFIQTAKNYFELDIRQVRSSSLIELIKNPEIRSKEGYRLKIDSEKIQIEAGYPAGCYYGLQSLLQLLKAGREDGRILCAVIDDEPEFDWRGIMLDESRHFFGAEQVKQILDFMALHKLNIFHWHLTDVPGWRIEIKKYPLLTTVGGIGNLSDKNAPPGYYTQKQITEIVEYARQRFIQIIPEIDMPGHATAAVKAYPEFSGGGSERYPDFTFNPGKEETYTFLTGILREVSKLFPSPYIHIGGDEVHFGNEQWKSLEDVKNLMETQNLKNLVEVEHYFLNRMADSVLQLGKTVMGWDEVVTAGLASDKTFVMWWRHDKPQLLEKALKGNYPVVLCPRIPLYFDFVQHESHVHGRKWQGRFAPVESIYDFPSPEFTGSIDTGSPLIQGIQGNVWTEKIHTPERLQFMLYPRLSVLAEAAWTTKKEKVRHDFLAG
jgi:hexosaminidase